MERAGRNFILMELAIGSSSELVANLTQLGSKLINFAAETRQF